MAVWSSRGQIKLVSECEMLHVVNLVFLFDILRRCSLRSPWRDMAMENCVRKIFKRNFANLLSSLRENAKFLKHLRDNTKALPFFHHYVPLGALCSRWRCRVDLQVQKWCSVWETDTHLRRYSVKIFPCSLWISFEAYCRQVYSHAVWRCVSVSDECTEVWRLRRPTEGWKS